MATPTPDRAVPFTTTAPARLLAAARAQATGRRLTLAAYLAELIRADLEAHGVTPPAPPPPKHNGPKPRANSGKTSARK